MELTIKIENRETTIYAAIYIDGKWVKEIEGDVINGFTKNSEVFAALAENEDLIEMIDEVVPSQILGM